MWKDFEVDCNNYLSTCRAASQRLHLVADDMTKMQQEIKRVMRSLTRAKSFVARSTDVLVRPHPRARAAPNEVPGADGGQSALTLQH